MLRNLSYASQTAGVTVEVNTRAGPQTGRAILYECAYAWTCRQVVMDLTGQIGVFDLNNEVVSIIVRVSESINGRYRSTLITTGNVVHCTLFSIFFSYSF